MTTISRTKQIILVFIMAICFSFCGIALSISNNKNGVFGAEIIGNENISITNQNFDSSSTKSLITSPSGWTVSSSDIDIKRGVITTTESDYSSYYEGYGLEDTANPGVSTGSDDKQVLMINGESSLTSLAFKSNDISLSANSYYVFSVNMKTQSNAQGSIYISGLGDNYDNTNSVVAQQSANWGMFKLFVKTGNAAKTAKIELWLGSKTSVSSEAVFFDDISLVKTSEYYFDSLYTSTTTKRLYDITNRNVIQQYGFEDASFAFNPETTSTGSIINTISDLEYPNLSSDNTKAFMINNSEETYSSYKSQDISINKNLIYKISVDVKIIGTLEGKGGALVKLVEKTNTEDDVKDCIKDYLSTYTGMSLATSSIATNNTNTQKNNYNTYSFYVKSNGLYNTKANLILCLGTSDSPAKGIVLFDDIKIETINQTEYDAVSTGTYVYKTELTIQTTTPTVTNGAFNYAKIENVDMENVVYPLAPADWTSETNYDSDTKKHKFGIISTNDSEYNVATIGISNPGNPSPYANTATSFNNELMFANDGNFKQIVKSSSISLSASTTYEISLFVKTSLSGGALKITLIDGTNNMRSFDTVNNTDWKQLKFIVKTGVDSKSINLAFELNNKGYVFLDDVRAISKSFDATAYENLVKTPPTDTQILDYADGVWHLTSNTLNENGVYTLLFFTNSLTSNSFAGAIPGKSNSYNVESENTSIYNNMLVIENNTAGESTITSNMGNNLTAEKFYRIDLKIYTKNLCGDDCGVTIKLSNVEQSFNNIISNDKFSTYSFYVSATEAATTKLSVSLTTTDSCSTAYAIFDDYSVTEITETTFGSKKSETETTPNNKVLIVGELAEETDDETETEEGENANENQDDQRWLLIPSILLAVSIIVALIGFSLRRIKIKKFKAKTETTYDRTKTLLKDIARREAEEKRAQEIARLEEELAQIQAEIDEYEQDYQNQLKEYRKARTELKIEKSKGRQQNIEKQFKEYAAKRAKFDEKTNAIKDKIDSMKNPEYVDAVEKKIIAKQKKLKSAEEKEIKKQQKLISKKESIEKKSKK